MEPSVFTRIINGEIPSHTVYEDENCIAFLDIHPMHEGHTLLVPKQQVDHLWDLDTDTYNWLWKTAKHIAPHLQRMYESARVGVVVEGFGVPHAHIHLIPIDTPEELKKAQDMDAEPNHEALADIATKIRQELDNGQ